MKVIVAGGREFDNYELMCTTLDYYFKDLDKKDLVIVSGRANGADKLGERYAREHFINVECYGADWKKYGNAAGPIRNRQMAENADALVAYHDGKSRGTKNMIETATELGLKVRVVNY